MFEIFKKTIFDFKNKLFYRIEAFEKISKNRIIIKSKLKEKFQTLDNTIVEIELILINYSRKFTKKKKNDLFKVAEFLPKEEGSCFIVHGHDVELLDEASNFICDTLNFSKPIILKKTKKDLSTIIEKFEEIITKVNYVFVLLSADDETSNNQFRARQNVIFELGYFIGKLSRRSGKIIILKKGDIELPSDINGMNIIDISVGLEHSKEEILNEIIK